MGWKLPPRRRPIVVDNRRGVPRAPGTPGRFLYGRELVTSPGQVLNDGDSPGLPSGIDLDPSLPGGTGLDYSRLNIDTGGVIKVVLGSAPPVATPPELVVPTTVFAWELISIRTILNTPVNGIDIPQLVFDDGPFAATGVAPFFLAGSNIYWEDEIGTGALGVGLVNVVICWSQGWGGRVTAFTAQHPVLGPLPLNNRLLSGHHVRLTNNPGFAANGFQFSAFVALVREWQAPR
jgi:hypothetical protein